MLDHPVFFSESVAQWSPANLPGIAPSIQVALSRSQGKLWQDAGKTVAAVANGDLVYVATCPFTGVDFVSGTGTTRPILTNISGNYWGLTFDGVNNVMGNTTAFTAGNTTCLGYKATSFPASAYVFDGGGLNQRALLFDTATFVRLYAGAGVAIAVADMTNSWRNTTAVFNGASSSLAQGGVSNTGNAVGSGATAGFNFGGNTTGRSIGVLSCCINVNALVSVANQTLLTAYVNGTHP